MAANDSSFGCEYVAAVVCEELGAEGTGEDASDIEAAKSFR